MLATLSSRHCTFIKPGPSCCTPAGGDLYEQLKRNGRLKEQEVASQVWSMLHPLQSPETYAAVASVTRTCFGCLRCAHPESRPGAGCLITLQ